MRVTSSLPNENYILNRTISITAHIVHSKEGKASTTLKAIEKDLAKCNKFFEKMKLSFKVCSVNNIYNHNYSTLVYPGDDPIPTKELKTKYFEPKTLNVYYVDTIVGSKSVCGFANMPYNSRDAIVIGVKSCMGDGIVMAHEIGHFLDYIIPFK